MKFSRGGATYVGERRKGLNVRELYTKLCKWSMNLGTIDGIFCHSFLVLSWNLACKLNNMGEVYLTEINWAMYFDTFDVFFAHTENQTGIDTKYLLHLYANQINPPICPLFALSWYFFWCCNSSLDLGSLLYPGRNQHSRFRDACWRENVDEVNTLGFSVQDIGTHSICKGAVSYLASRH